MCDEIDQAQNLELLNIEIGIANRKPTMTFTGFCHFAECRRKIHEGMFCDADCRDDFEYDERKKKECGMSRGTIICLCDLTGIMAGPWLSAGYDAILIDPQHIEKTNQERIRKWPDTVLTAASALGDVIRKEEIVFVAGFPPCTDVAVSGAAHFEKKRNADTHFQAKAALIAEQCRMVGEITGAPWFFENPVSVFSGIFGKPDFIFNPSDYGSYLPEHDVHPTYPDYIAPRDAYPKKTCLWTGGGFVMPDKLPVSVPDGYSTQYLKLGGKSERVKNMRSATPRGFAEAVFQANAPHLKALREAA